MKHIKLLFPILVIAGLVSCTKKEEPKPVDSSSLALSNVVVSESVTVPGAINVSAKVSDTKVALSTLDISAALEDGTVLAQKSVRTSGNEAVVEESLDIPFAANMPNGAKVIVNLKAINVNGENVSQTASSTIVRPAIPETIYMKIGETVYPMTKSSDNIYQTEAGDYEGVITASFATAEDFSEAPIIWGKSTVANHAEICSFSDATGVEVSFPTYIVTQYTFNTLSFEVGVVGQELHVSINGTELLPQAGGLLYAKINFTKDSAVTISGIDDVENAYNRDFFAPDGNGYKFLRESGEYDVYYSPKYNYIWVAKMSAVGPECLWIIGHGFTCAPVWHEDFGFGGWAADYIYQLGYCVKIADNLYQCSMYLSNEHEWGTFEFEVYSDLAWSKEYGFGVKSITGFTKGIAPSPAADGMPGLTSDSGFQPGYYVITFNTATGEANLNRITEYVDSGKSGIFINGTELDIDASGFDYANIEFTNGETVAFSGIDASELNRDFFSIKDGVAKFVGVSGTYKVQYFPDYKYTWLISADMSFPDCIYILGSGKFAAPEYSTQANWDLDAYDRNAPMVVVAPKIAENTYKATMSMSTDNTNWRVLIEFYSDLSWGQEGVKPVEITGPAASRFYLGGESLSWLCGVDEAEDPFQVGNYEFIFTSTAEGLSINVTKLD